MTYTNTSGGVPITKHLKSLSRVKRQQESPLGTIMRLISGLAIIAGPIASIAGGASGLGAMAATVGGALAGTVGSIAASRLMIFFQNPGSRIFFLHQKTFLTRDVTVANR